MEGFRVEGCNSACLYRLRRCPDRRHHNTPDDADCQGGVKLEAADHCDASPASAHAPGPTHTSAILSPSPQRHVGGVVEGGEHEGEAQRGPEEGDGHGDDECLPDLGADGAQADRGGL
eukprot:CAMPEP_0181373492 /NCGR_PEP_ID=MMETSP1106-20121128/15410_1 /TAXON_ID=81844 /ORGANISM="Mantoniella antarctica, Strain SL-175" /LENGTH=117 /DNA_ID=CAMNT_0023491199 /DNA_START=195 /DNA_END=543 /DNA_ORIENTATION=+